MNTPRVSRYEWTEYPAATYEAGAAVLRDGEELVISADPSHFFETPKNQKDFTRMMAVRGARAYIIRLYAPERRQKATGNLPSSDARERSGPRG